MPKIHYASDLHIETQASCLPIFKVKRRKSDWLVLAGDILTNTLQGQDVIEDFLNEIAPYYKYVLVVLGNHCYRGYRLEERINWKLSSNVYVLTHDTPITLDGISVFGDILWSYTPPLSEMAVESLGDYQRIYDRSYFRITARYTNDYHFNVLKDLYAFLSNGDGKKIVITHFPPMYVDCGYPSTALSCYFENHILSNVLWYERNLQYYFFGHIHQEHDETIDGIRFLCNPRGYPSEVPNFKLKWVKV